MELPAKAERCRSDSCEEGDCSLDVSGLGKQIEIIDLNCIKSRYRLRGRISDFGIVWRKRNIVAVVELKGGQGGKPLKTLVEQIQLGLDALSAVLDGQTVRDFYPLLLYRKKAPIAALRGTKVVLQGKKRSIIPRRCGTRLSAILKEFPS